MIIKHVDIPFKSLLFLVIFIFLFFGALSSQNSKLQFSTGDRPNIVFFLVDDLGWSDLPSYGNKFNESPHIDKFAKEGLLFSNAYAAGAVCSPTRASIISGQYPARLGIFDFIPGHWRPFEEFTVPHNKTQHLPTEVVSIGEVAKAAGYKTGYFGKWHLGGSETHHPSKQGFDEAYTSVGKYYGVKFNPSIKMDSSTRLSTKLTDLGIDFINSNKNEPFFLFMSHFDVHTPFDADSLIIKKYIKKSKVDGYPCNPVYASMIAHVDNSLKRVEDCLTALSLTDNTIIIFYSDNGGLISRYDMNSVINSSKNWVYPEYEEMNVGTSNKPLKGEKGNLYEGGIRVPLIIKWPGKIRPGKTNQIVSSIDFFPTIKDLVQNSVKYPDIDGLDLVPFLVKQKQFNRTLYWHYPVYHHGNPSSAIRKGKWKLIHDLTTEEKYLYNLETDLSENIDLSGKYPKIYENLIVDLQKWRNRLGVTYPTLNPEFDEDRRMEWGVNPYKTIN